MAVLAGRRAFGLIVSAGQPPGTNIHPAHWHLVNQHGGDTRDITVAGLPSSLREAHEILASGAAQILPENGLAERLLAAERESRPLRVKLGIDPSGSQLTLGHAVVLRKLRQFQDLGHLAVLVVGGFTGQVGDPSGRTATRSAQSAEDVRLNASGYFGQLMRVLDEDRVEIVNNADWLAPMRLTDILDYTRQMTIAQLLERDDFARRFAARQPITLSEFFYPLLQGIDSVEIHADIELGGTDQTFNNLVGRELQRARGQDPQAVLTVPLLVGTDGTEKMSKSLGNFIAIDDPADEQFGKLMSIPDTLVGMYARLCTAMHPREVDQIERQVAGSFVYGLSALFYGECTVKDGRIEQTNFDTYNSMRIAEMPKVESIIMPSGGFWGGVGEPTIFVAAPAVLNAFFAATGKRIRSVPLKNHNISFA